MPDELDGTAPALEDEEVYANSQELDYGEARNGDHLFTSFECEWCIFFRLQRREPVFAGSIADGSEARALGGLVTDARMMECCRRANLDAFWSRASNTIKSNLATFKRLMRVQTDSGLAVIGPPPGKGGTTDFGESVAIMMLLDSLNPGLHGARKKFSAIRSIRSCVTNVSKARADMVAPIMAMRDGARYRQITALPTDSVWFLAFASGMESRLGDRLKQDLALTPEVVVGVLDLYEEEWNQATEDQDRAAKVAAAEGACFFVLTYAAGLRGFEVPKVRLTHLLNQFEDGGPDGRAHIGLPLMGQFKARGRQVVNLIMFIVQETDSGVKSGVWLRRLANQRIADGRTEGWLYEDEEGRQVKTRQFSEPFYRKLLELQEDHPEMFGRDVDVLEEYGPIRSGRRGANTRALKMLKGRKDQVDWFFRWNTGGAETSAREMHVHYADRSQLVSLFLHVSEKL